MPTSRGGPPIPSSSLATAPPLGVGAEVPMSEIGIYLRAGERNALSSVHSRLAVWAVRQDGGHTSNMAFGDKNVIMGICGYPGFASVGPPHRYGAHSISSIHLRCPRGDMESHHIPPDIGAALARTGRRDAVAYTPSLCGALAPILLEVGRGKPTHVVDSGGYGR